MATTKRAAVWLSIKWVHHFSLPFDHNGLRLPDKSIFPATITKMPSSDLGILCDQVDLIGILFPNRLKPPN